jgi:TolB-like protein
MSPLRLGDRTPVWYLALAALGATPAAQAQSQPVVIAILPFEDRGSYGQDKEVFRALQLGIPATIAGELAGHPELRLADAGRITRALPSGGVNSRTRLDASTAAQVGKEAGARYAITGSFADFYGKIRLDARIIDTSTGQILKVVSNDPRQDDRSQLYSIIQTVGHKVLAAASGVGAGRAPPPNENRTIPTEALTEYSLGLLYEREGDKTRAGEHYQRAIATFSDYRDAREALTRVRGS